MKSFRDKTLPVEERVELLLSELTPEEKLGFVDYRNKGVERLGIPPYSWWNEALHGLARSGTATVFPQAIAMAAAFDPKLVEGMGRIIADETRARYFSSRAKGDFDTYKGLTQWSPNVNIFRDPRWGRGHETYGECPYLSGLLGSAFVRGLQGNDPEKLRVAATPKHFAVHSGPEKDRAGFNAEVSERDLRETYLQAFKACVKGVGAKSVMTAYNAVNGEPSSTNRRLVTDILRGEWGFDGAVVTDVGVMRNLVNHHKTQADGAHAIAAELAAGVDVVSDPLNGEERAAFEKGLISEADLDRILRRQLRIKFMLGMFDDDPDDVPPFECIACPEHRRASLEAARRSVVLLKNRGSILPLKMDKLSRIAVIGPNASYMRCLLGNYSGTPLHAVTPLDGILEAAGEDVRVFYARGCEPSRKRTEGCANYDGDRTAEALTAAENSDVVIGFFGLNPDMEGEIGDASNADASGDKSGVELPEVQLALIRKLAETGKPFVLVNISGSAVAIPEEYADAVLQVFYPGELGGRAIADVLFGRFNPCGRLPVTFYRSTADLPPFTDYSMENRTYRFFGGEALYPFGAGMSYTRFEYSDLRVSRSEDGRVRASVTAANAGGMAGEHSVLFFVSLPEAGVRTPVRQLAGIARVSLAPGETAKAEAELWPDAFRAVLPDGSVTDAVGRAVVCAGELRADVC